MLCHEAHGLTDAPMLLWATPLPNGVSINNLLRSVLMENPARRWLVPMSKEDTTTRSRFSVATFFIVRGARLMGVRLPIPERVGVDDAGQVAAIAAELVRTEGTCLVRLSVSAALRVGLAASRLGIDLTGVTLMGGGEPVSEAKARGIVASGAKWVPTYVITEAGPVGVGCANPIDASDVHLCDDTLGIVQRSNAEMKSPVDVGEFAFTTLLRGAPRLMINVDSDDFGILETRSCGCALGEAGFARHVRGVGSFRKLTGEGITLVGSDIERVIDEVLPGRFGGSPFDYQLVEEEDAEGFTRLTVLVSPDVDIRDESAVVSAVLDGLARTTDAGDSASGVLRHARSLRVRRERPAPTVGGKHPVFRSLVRR
jgi:hypothetical protein